MIDTEDRNDEDGLRARVFRFFDSHQGESFLLDDVADAVEERDIGLIYRIICSLRKGRTPTLRGRSGNWNSGPLDPVLIAVTRDGRGPGEYGIPEEAVQGDRYMIVREKLVFGHLQNVTALANQWRTRFPGDLVVDILANSVNRVTEEVQDAIRVQEELLRR